MEILLIHLGTVCECFIASSVIKGLKKKYKEKIPFHLYSFVSNQESNSVFKYNNNIKLSYIIDKTPKEFKEKEFDLIINLNPEFSEEKYFTLKSKEKLGFNYTEKGNITKEFMYDGKKTQKNIFQMYYILAGLKWKGEGYSFYYHPKYKNKKDRTGLYITNENLFNYITKRLKLDLSNIWNIPQRKNIFRKLDEINKCSQVVTNDFFILNLALSLRKNVFFLETEPFNHKLELFNCGKVFQVPKRFL